MTKREPFAKVELESDDLGWMVVAAGETIVSGDGYWHQSDAEEMANALNAAVEARVEEEVRKAVSEFKMAMTDQMDTLEKSAMNCPSCGLLYPDHGGRCGLYVRREAVDEFRNRADREIRKKVHGAHTYASENADVYRAYDAGRDAALKILKSFPTDPEEK